MNRINFNNICEIIYFKSYKVVYFRRNSRKNLLQILGTSLAFKIVKQQKKILVNQFENFATPFEYKIYDEEHPDFYKQNYDGVSKFVNLNESYNKVNFG